VLALLGEKWLAVVPMLKVLAYAGALQSVVANNHSAYLAAGKSHLPALLNLVFVAALVPLMFALNSTGVIGIAYAVLVATVVVVVASFVPMRRYVGTTLLDMAGAAWRPLLAAATMGLVVQTLDQHQFAELPAYARLVADILCGGVVYTALAALLWAMTGRKEGLERMVYDRARVLLGRSPN
jgi:O-antigen/teichoic acid export membrane protein